MWIKQQFGPLAQFGFKRDEGGWGDLVELPTVFTFVPKTKVPDILVFPQNARKPDL